MNVTKAALEKRVITSVAIVLLVVGGLLAYRSLPRAEDPGFIVRTALVLTYFPGASPQRVEQLVTDKLEKAIQEIPELDFVNSESKTGVSIVYVNIKERYKEMRPIWDDLRRKVEAVRDDLPDGVLGPYVNDDFGDVFGIVLGITGEGFSYAEIKQVADDVRDELLRLDEVARVDIYGAQDERVFLEFDNARLADLGLSPLQLRQILAARNIIIPGGSIRSGSERLVLEPSGNFESIDDLRRTLIPLPGRHDMLALQDIVDVRRGYVDPPSALMRVNGRPALGLGVSLREGGNIIKLGEQVEPLLRHLQEVYPIGVQFDVIAFQPKAVAKKVNEFVVNLLESVVIVGGTMLLIMGLRTGLIVASLIPSTMIISILVMSIFGIGIDQMSLASLIIALGMLVDNAIVMSESIMVQMGQGKRAFDAALDSANELRIALLNSSLTTAAAFLPIFLAESSTGEYTAPLFKVVTIALLVSWGLALTMTPLMCARFLRVKENPEQQAYDTRFYRRYRATLTAALRHPWLVVAGTVGVFVLALAAFRFVPVLFFPPSDRTFFLVEMDLPWGTAIERTQQSVTHLETFMQDSLMVAAGRPGVTNWATFIGQGAPRFVLSYNPEQSKPEYAMMIVNTSKFDAMDGLMERIGSFCNRELPDSRVTVRRIDNGPPVTHPVEVRLSGRDARTLFTIVDAVKRQLEQIPGTRDIDDDWGNRTKKLQVIVDQTRARLAGVTNQDVAVSLQTMLSGLETTQFREQDKVIPVVLRSTATDREDIDRLAALTVFSQVTGNSVPLSQVADVQVEFQPPRIMRRSRLKTVTVSAELRPGFTATQVVRALSPWLSQQSRSWGLGYGYAFGGEQESSGKANESIAAKLPIAALIIVLLLVLQFNSLRKPLIILMIIPLGIIGVVAGLLIARSYFGFMTLLGIISLAGVVINNGIVLLDRIQIEIDQFGRTPQQAIVESAQRRLRPILLTTGTTVGGLLPLWFGGGAMWQPMAIALIFGLSFGTMLTLGVVPVLYSLFFKVRYE